MLQTLQRQRVMVLVTSRQSVGATLGLAEMLQLAALKNDVAEALLLTMAGKFVEWSCGEASQPVDICGCNALAIVMLAGFIRSKYCTPAVSSCESHCPVAQCLLARYSMLDCEQHIRSVFTCNPVHTCTGRN